MPSRKPGILVPIGEPPVSGAIGVRRVPEAYPRDAVPGWAPSSSAPPTPNPAWSLAHGEVRVHPAHVVAGQVADQHVVTGRESQYDVLRGPGFHVAGLAEVSGLIGFPGLGGQLAGIEVRLDDHEFVHHDAVVLHREGHLA